MRLQLGWDMLIPAGLLVAALVLLGVIGGYLLDELHHRRH